MFQRLELRLKLRWTNDFEVVVGGYMQFAEGAGQFVFEESVSLPVGAQ